MNGTYTDDDALSDEERLDQDRLLNERGIRREEVSDEEAEELLNDIQGEDTDGLSDDDDRLSDVVTEEENDGND